MNGIASTEREIESCLEKKTNCTKSTIDNAPEKNTWRISKDTEQRIENESEKKTDAAVPQTKKNAA